MRTLPEYLASDRCPGDRTAYLAYAQEAHEQFRPASFLELHFAAEIIRDTWRSSLIARIDENQYSDISMEALRRSRDRLNAEIRRNTAELRRLQTNRILSERADLNLPLPAAARDILRLEQKLEKRAAASKSTAESKVEPTSLEPTSAEPTVPGPADDKPAAPEPTKLRRNEPKSPPPTSLADIEALLRQDLDRIERKQLAEWTRATGRSLSVPLNRAA